MIGEKIAKIMSEIEPIVKTEVDKEGGYKSPKAEKIITMVQPLLAKFKVAVVPVEVPILMPQGKKVYIKMKYRFIDLESKEKDFLEVEIPGSRI